MRSRCVTKRFTFKLDVVFKMSVLSQFHLNMMLFHAKNYFWPPSKRPVVHFNVTKRVLTSKEVAFPRTTSEQMGTINVRFVFSSNFKIFRSRLTWIELIFKCDSLVVPGIEKGYCFLINGLKYVFFSVRQLVIGSCIGKIHGGRLMRFSLLFALTIQGNLPTQRCCSHGQLREEWVWHWNT